MRACPATYMAGRNSHLLRLYKMQDRLCHWCKCQMSLAVPKLHESPRKDLATIDHLDSRYNPLRGSFKGQLRHVAACWECNQKRCDEETKALPIQELRRRAGRNRFKLGDFFPPSLTSD